MLGTALLVVGDGVVGRPTARAGGCPTVVIRTAPLALGSTGSPRIHDSHFFPSLGRETSKSTPTNTHMARNAHA